MSKKYIIILIIIIFVIIAINTSKKKNTIIDNIDNKLIQNSVSIDYTEELDSYYVVFNLETRQYDIKNSNNKITEFSCNTEEELITKYEELTGKEYMH